MYNVYSCLKTRWNTSLRSTKSGGGEQLLPLDFGNGSIMLYYVLRTCRTCYKYYVKYLDM